jgi:hypothetical protein
LLLQTVGNELVVYDQARQQVHNLNPTAAMIWRYCDGQTTVAEGAALLSEEFNILLDDKVVWLAVEQLEEAQLLEQTPKRPAIAGNISRRDILRRLGQGAASMALLPLVTSIIAPTSAMAASPGDPVGCTSECQQARTECGMSCGSDESCFQACDQAFQDCIANC